MTTEFNPVSQDCGISLGDKRIGTAVNASLTIATGAERLETDSGYSGHGSGTEADSCRITTIVFKEGMPYDPHALLMEALDTKQYITLTAEIAGQPYAMNGKITGLEVSYDAVKRTAQGNWTWEGGNRQKV